MDDIIRNRAAAQIAIALKSKNQGSRVYHVGGTAAIGTLWYVISHGLVIYKQHTRRFDFIFLF